MSRAPLMPKATAVWLVENTALTFRQIADFAGLHELEVKGVADGDVACGDGRDMIVSIEPRRGYGRAIKAGIAAVRGDADIILFLDGDGSDPTEFIPDLLSPIVAGKASLAIGSRVRGAREPGSLSLQQVVAAHVARVLLRLLYGASFTDMSPFRAIRRDELGRLGMREETYGWNLEMLMRVAAARLPALEIAVGQRRRIGGVSKGSGNPVAGVKAAWSISKTFVRLARELRTTRRQ